MASLPCPVWAEHPLECCREAAASQQGTARAACRDAGMSTDACVWGLFPFFWICLQVSFQFLLLLANFLPSLSLSFSFLNCVIFFSWRHHEKLSPRHLVFPFELYHISSFFDDKGDIFRYSHVYQNRENVYKRRQLPNLAERFNLTDRYNQSQGLEDGEKEIQSGNKGAHF